MNILFSLTYYTPYISGLTLYGARLIEQLAKRGHTMVVLCMQHTPSLSQKEQHANISILRAKPLFRLSKGFFSLQWVQQAWQQTQHADSIVVNLPQFEAVILALFARMWDKPLVVIYHCDILLPNTLGNRIVLFFLSLSHRITLASATRIVTYTEDFATHSSVLAPFVHTLQCIYPPIRVPRQQKEKTHAFRTRIGKTDIIIGVAARLAAEKGIEYLLEAIPYLNSEFRIQSSELKEKKIKIVVAGPMEPVGEEAYKKNIMKLVAAYNDDVVFLGTVAPDEMGSFYALVDIVVLPSINSTEAFGMVQVEAMMMGVPVVATNLPGVRIPVQVTGMGEIVPVKDSAAIATAISRVLLGKKKYSTKKKQIEKIFAEEKTIAFYETLFKEITS